MISKTNYIMHDKEYSSWKDDEEDRKKTQENKEPTTIRNK